MFRRFALALLGCLYALPAPAQGSPQPAERSAAMGAEIEVASAERLALRFPGSPELTGEYRIAADGMISIPILGRISIVNMSVQQLEQTLSRQVEQLTGRQNYVTVEVAAYRPVFVTGLVSRSGSVPWYPGMTVLQGVTVSGGLYRPIATEGGSGLVAGEAELAKLRRATEDQKRVLAATARLRAERDGLNDIPMPPALISLAGQREAEDLIARQKPLFVSRRAALQHQLSTLDRAMKLASQELEVLRDQSKRIDEQLRMRKEARQKLAELQVKGIVLAQRTLEEDIKVSELEERTAATAVATARIQATIASMQREYVLLTEERKANIEGELDRMEREASQHALDAAAAQQARQLIAGTAAAAFERAGRVEIVYQVVRREKSGETIINAQQSTLLKPGDVLVVSQETRGSG